MNRIEAVRFLKKYPYKFGHMIGFNKLTALHNKWMVDMLTTKHDKTLQAHRGSYKTTCVSVVLALIMVLLPNKRTLFVRKTDDDVKEIIKQVKNILKDPHMQVFVNAIYGVSADLTVDNSTELNTNLTTDLKGTSQLVGIGIGSSLTGKHFDFIFTDDIVNLKDRRSKAERDRTKSVYQELENVKNRDGRIYNTGTPWHKDDCFTLMPSPKKYDCYSTGLMTEEQIEHLKQSMAPSLFSANYKLRHIASEDVIFTEPKQGADKSLVLNGIAHLDCAFYGDDYTAFTVGRVINGTVYLYGRMWRQHVEDLYPTICDLYREFLCGKLYNERNADKGIVARDLRQMGIRTVSYDESMNKYIKIVTYLKHVWKDVVFIEGTDPEYIEQICDYTENASHDDAPDSAASLVRVFYPKIGGTKYQPIYN